MANTDSPHGLLLRHFTDWARAKGRSVDPGLLGELLHLRSAYDELEPTYWPLGSVEQLLLERWPSKGGVDVPELGVLVETLDAYFRFLRSTGRMSSRSGDPKSLTREARRAAQRMPEAAADVANWSPTKVLLDYGRSLGIDVDDAPDEETLKTRLALIQELWNAQPVDDRLRRMPRPEGATPPQPDPSSGGLQRAISAHGTHDPTLALILTFADDLPSGRLPAPEAVAAIFEEAPYFQNLRALAEWVGAGREVTATGVLRPALAHEVHDLLGLDAWTRSQLHRRYPDERYRGVAAVGLDAWIEQEATRPWSRAADCAALHRLWCGAIACGAIGISGKNAIAVDQPGSDTERSASMGIRSAIGVMNLLLQTHYSAAPIVYALMTSYVRERGPVSMDEIMDFVTDWRRSPEDQAYYGDLEFDVRDFERPAVDGSLGQLADTGVYVESADGVTLTAAGEVFVAAWLKYIQNA